MLSVETSVSQDKSQIWSAMAILTALLATVGLSKKAFLPIEPNAKTKGSLWQRVKNRLGFGKDKHKAMCESGYCDDCCSDCGEMCLYTILILLGATIYLMLIVFLIGEGLMLAALIMMGIPILVLIIFLIGKGIDNYTSKKAEQKYQKEQDIKAEAKKKQIDAANAKALEQTNTFFAQNALRPEVVTLPSGLQYEILNQGDPTKPVVPNTQVRIRHDSDLNNLDIVPKRDLAIWQNPFNFTKELDINKLLPYVGSSMRIYYPPQHPNNGYENNGLYYEVERLGTK